MGLLKNGRLNCARQYNRTLARLEQMEAVDPGFFDPVSDEAGFDEIGVAASLLADYLGADDEEIPGPHVLFRTRPGAKRAFQLRIRDEIGDAVREHLPEWMREGTVRFRKGVMIDEKPGAEPGD